MNFLFKRKEIVLDCFTFDELIAQCSPIESATKFLPDWFINLPNTYQSKGIYEKGTMKYCKGMRDLYKNAFAMPMWAELAIKVADGGFSWQFSDYVSNAHIHDVEARGTFLPTEQYGQIMLISPWALKTKENLNWVMTQATYNFEELNSINLMPGVLNFAEQHSANLNISINLRFDNHFFIPTGQPMAYLFPMTEKIVKVKRHVVSLDEWNKLQNVNIVKRSFYNCFMTGRRLQKQFSDCPYSKKI